MGFGYIGYIWSIIGCLLMLTVFGGAFAILYGLGKRMEKREGTRTVVEPVSLRRKGSPEEPPPANAPPDDAA